MANHEESEKKPIYKKWWFWVIAVVIVLIIAASQNTNTVDTSTNSYQQNNAVEVTIIDFSTMQKEEVKNWLDTNKLNGNITEEYSNDVAKGNFVSQSISANTIAHQGDKITIVYSLGKEPTTEEKNALKKAESYSSKMYMSKKAIYDQLTSQYGEKFSADAAQYAIDNLQVDFNANALEKAKSYQSRMSMSKSAIYDQLVSQYGEKFTKSEAQYAIDHLDD